MGMTAVDEDLDVVVWSNFSGGALWMLCMDGELQTRIFGCERSLDLEFRLTCEP